MVSAVPLCATGLDANATPDPQETIIPAAVTADNRALRAVFTGMSFVESKER